MIKRSLNKLKWFLIGLKKNYKIDGFNIELSKHHMLPIHQHNYCYYDRVLPAIVALSNRKNSASWVIDIGANVGDTLFSMLKHTTANLLCIEPDLDFYKILEKNVATLNEQYKKKVYCLNAFVVSDTSENIKLEKKLGTAHKVKTDSINDHTPPSLQLKDIISQYGIAPDSIDLIKVDTDGYDWECLISLGPLLQEIDGYIYWENQLDKGSIKQQKGYQQLIDYLKAADYECFFCFDNFGNYLASGDSEFLLEINNYLDRLNEKKTARTFYYVDVLACKKDKVSQVKEMLQQFYQ